MKAFNLVAVLLVLATISVVSCKKTDLKEDPISSPKTMSALKADAGFTWETTRNLDVRLSGNSTGVVYIRPVAGDYYFYKGLLTSGTLLTTKITIPSYINKVRLTFKGKVHEISVTGNKLVFNF